MRVFYRLERLRLRREHAPWSGDLGVRFPRISEELVKWPEVVTRELKFPRVAEPSIASCRHASTRALSFVERIAEELPFRAGAAAIYSCRTSHGVSSYLPDPNTKKLFHRQAVTTTLGGKGQASV